MNQVMKKALEAGHGSVFLDSKLPTDKQGQDIKLPFILSVLVPWAAITKMP